jgi:AraC-like DNA-binding protein
VSGRRTSALHRELIAEVLEFIEEHIGDRELSLQLVADAFDTGVSNLSRLFKAQTGENFSPYVASRRVEVAKQLLAAGKGNYVRDVAMRVGYDNTHSFSRVFRRMVGVSPSYYREHARLAADPL